MVFRSMLLGLTVISLCAPTFAQGAPDADSFKRTVSKGLSAESGPAPRKEISDAEANAIMREREDVLTSDEPKRLRIQALRLEIDAALAQENIDKVHVMELNSQIVGLQSDLATNQIKRQIAAAESMPLEQRKRTRIHLLMGSPEHGPFPFPPGGPAGFPPHAAAGFGPPGEFGPKVFRFGAPPPPEAQCF